MFGIFKKKANSGVIAPVSGVLIKLEDVNDPVFSQKLMGDGFAIKPSDGLIVAPIGGKIVSLPDSKHAVGIKNNDGLEILVHIGIDTVNLNGTGFRTFAKEGQEVKQGQKLVEVDLNLLKERQIDSTVMTMFTAGYDKEIKPTVSYGSSVTSGNQVIE